MGFALAGAGLIWLGRLDWLRVDWSDPVGWLEVTDTEALVAALARLAGLATVGWVLASTLVYLLVRMLGWRPSHLQWLSVGPIRRAVDALVAGSLVVSTMAPAAALVDPGTLPPPSTTTVESIEPDYVPAPARPDTPPTPTRPDTPPTPTRPAYVPTPAGSGEASSPPTSAPDEPREARPPPGGLADADPPGRATVQPGDSFWLLAARHLESEWGRSPTDAEIAPYWVQVVETNRHHIRSGDPDLIFPGEELMLPPLED